MPAIIADIRHGQTTPAPAPTTKAGKADDEEDNEVAPTPIAYVIKPALCKFYTNGRVEAINEPIPGFEHCRRAQKPHQGLPGSSSSRQAQLPGKQAGLRYTTNTSLIITQALPAQNNPRHKPTPALPASMSTQIRTV
jgi:hypothetical protein